MTQHNKERNVHQIWKMQFGFNPSLVLHYLGTGG